MKTIIVYQSTYGHAEKYALWLCEALSSLWSDQKPVLKECSKTGAKDLLACDLIVFLGSVHIGSVSGFSLVAKNYSKLKDKSLILCSVGLTFPEDAAEIEKIHKKTLGEAMANVPAFYLQGGLAWSRLGFLHKNMMKMLGNELKKKAAPTKMEQVIISRKNADFTTKEALAPVVSYITSL